MPRLAYLQRGSVHRAALLTWLGVYPLLTLIAWLLAPILAPLHLPARTLVMSAVMVPVMMYGVMPFMARYR